MLAPALTARLGQTVLVENQGGGNGLLAMQSVARAEPDGHTILVTGDAIVLAELATPNAGFTVRGSFTPVTQAVLAEVESRDETVRGAGGFGSTGTAARGN